MSKNRLKRLILRDLDYWYMSRNHLAEINAASVARDVDVTEALAGKALRDLEADGDLKRCSDGKLYRLSAMRRWALRV
jgi:hypothetical protein